MTPFDKVIIPLWMYERMVKVYGEREARERLKAMNALAVENWEDAFGDD